MECVISDYVINTITIGYIICKGRLKFVLFMFVLSINRSNINSKHCRDLICVYVRIIWILVLTRLYYKWRSEPINWSYHTFILYIKTQSFLFVCSELIEELVRATYMIWAAKWLVIIFHPWLTRSSANTDVIIISSTNLRC